MASQSVSISGPEITAIRASARHNGVIVSIGVSEKVEYSTATLFNSNVIIGSDGELLVHHRKLMPTFFEKLTWSPGDGHGLRVADTKAHGKIGALICGENTNPLARYALMAQGEQVHISSWPAVWPTRLPKSTQGASGAGPKNYDNVSANRTRAAAHCFEAKCFGILCAAHLSDENVKAIAEMTEDPESTSTILQSSQRAASMFLDPTGASLPSFTINEHGKQEAKDFLQHEEGILYADLDLDQCVEGKQYHDVVGGYQRLDVFELKVDRSRREPAIFTDTSMLTTKE